MNELLFSTPFWFPLCIIAVGIVTFISGNNRQQPRVRLTGIGIVALSFLLMLVSYLVETDKEKVDHHMHELISAVQKPDWEKMKSLLSDNVSLRTVNLTVYPNRAGLLQGAANAVDHYQLKSITITSMQTDQTQSGITVGLSVLTMQDYTQGYPVPSTWQFEWEPSAKDWTLSRIICVSVGNQNLNQIQTLFPK